MMFLEEKKNISIYDGGRGSTPPPPPPRREEVNRNNGPYIYNLHKLCRRWDLPPKKKEKKEEEKQAKPQIRHWNQLSINCSTSDGL